jgi:hypothetical protein
MSNGTRIERRRSRSRPVTDIPSNLESLVRKLKADGGMAWASSSCQCTRCALMREIDAELERPVHETTAEPDEFQKFLDGWMQAYPLDIFPLPDFVRAHAVLKEAGISLDCISAANFRHVLLRVSNRYAEKAEAVPETTACPTCTCVEWTKHDNGHFSAPAPLEPGQGIHSRRAGDSRVPCVWRDGCRSPVTCAARGHCDGPLQVKTSGEPT